MHAISRYFLFLTLAMTPAAASADLVITQYYQDYTGILYGPQHSWLEILNTSDQPINLSAFNIGVWRNDNTGGYKTGNTPSSSGVLPNLTIAPGAVGLISNPGAQPTYAQSGALTTAQLDQFSPNGSVGIYSGARNNYQVANLIDAIGFADGQLLGSDQSWVRLTLDPGYDLNPGSDVTDFPDVWQSFSIATVSNPSVTGDARLGVANPAPASVAAIPEATPWKAGLAVSCLLLLGFAWKKFSVVGARSCDC